MRPGTCRRCLVAVPGLLAAATWLSACAGGAGIQSPLNPAGPAASRIAALGWFVIIVFSVATVVMWVLFGVAIARRRGTLAEHEPWDAPDDMRWIGIGGLLIPIVVRAIALVYNFRTMAAFPMEHSPDPPAIEVVGHQWWWEVHYVGGPLHGHTLTANEIHIPVGQLVDIDLTSYDVIHSFWVPRLHGKVDLIPGQTNRIRIEASQPGVYRGQCAEYCGEQHAHMILLIVADPPGKFQDWLNAQRQPAVEPTDDRARRGQVLFETHTCGLCHAVRGTQALATVGPDLTHLASRQFIAANYLPNTDGNLEAWVTHAQSLKPGAQMPNMTEFNGEELRDLVAYLRQLK